ncbi:PilZ domain-containing protein [Chitiniphilus purpureus]|uniref:PilZ domain-containing protein n=1 Tax=Chitiniphilus purpureus TaxID=2981137 RepID=A0ABY6DJ80_9NEIS|nr:PilZ domain-containing protein [Chitiniphilus sp. CD1]UXY14298.1 PilZ domain-containing protein [Chitiniphilus sp. CD1]
MNDAVHFTARLPLAWRAQGDQSAFEAARFLDVLTALEHGGEDAPDARDAKIDLQLLWLARLLTPSLPPETDVRIGIEHAVWMQPEPLSAGQPGWLSFSPSTVLPFLLCLPAQVVACDAAAGRHRIGVRWTIAEGMLREAFERMVFRRHREQIRRERAGQP